MTAARFADVRRWTRRVLPWICVMAVIVWSARSETARDEARFTYGAVVIIVCGFLILAAWMWSLDGDTERNDDHVRILERAIRIHDERLTQLSRELDALCKATNVMVLPAVVDDSPGAEEPPITEPMPAQKPSPRPRDEPADTVESHAVVVGGMRLGPAAQKAADDLERMIAEIRMRTAERTRTEEAS